MSSLLKRVELLKTGKAMPILGLGTWQLHDNTQQVIRGAVKAGYRHFDCAAVYENEHQVGEALHAVLADPAEYGTSRAEVRRPIPRHH
jgi:diketogulonate reductase-like aldo/keto reductase